MASFFQAQGFPATVQRILQHPVVWPAFASLGVHVLLFVALPFLPPSAFKSQEPEPKRSVEVVELSSAEQRRLPEFTTPTTELPPLTQLPRPPLPNSTPPSLSSIPGGASLLIPQLPPAPNFSPAPIPVYPRGTTIIPPFPRQPLPPTPSPAPTASPALPTVSPASPTPGASGPQPSTPQPPVNANPDVLAGISPIPTSSPTTTPQSGPTAAAAASPTPRSPEEITQALKAENEELQRLVYIRRGTTQEEFQTSYLGWLEKVRRWMEDETYNPLRNQKTIDGSYPEAACRRTMPATSAVIGVGVDADGKVVTDVELVVLRSSGFQVFNEQAIEDAKAAEFEATGKPEAYYVIVNYPEHSAEVCPSQPAEGEPPPSAAPSTPTG